MSMIERTDLGFERDQLLFDKWEVNRVNLEHYHQELISTPDSPWLAIKEAEESMHILDTMLAYSVGRMRFYGSEIEQLTIEKLSFIEWLIHSIKHPEKVKDCLDCKPEGRILW